MSAASASTETAGLRLTKSASAIAAGALCLTIPSAFAERSLLITELRQQLDVDEEVFLPLPLLLQDFQAWLSFANHLDGSIMLKTAGVESGKQDDEALVNAIKVRGYEGLYLSQGLGCELPCPRRRSRTVSAPTPAQ